MDSFTIYGQPPSKSNAYRVVKIAGHASLAKTKATHDYEDKFFMQCPCRGAMIGDRFRMSVDVYFTSDRPDLDNALKVILDCLQLCKAIKNDRQCAELHARKLIDKKDPRAVIAIEAL